MDSRTTNNIPTASRVSAELVSALTTAGLQIKDKSGYLPFVILPEGYKTEKLTAEYLEPLPDHIQQRVRIIELEVRCRAEAEAFAVRRLALGTVWRVLPLEPVQLRPPGRFFFLHRTGR